MCAGVERYASEIQSDDGREAARSFKLHFVGVVRHFLGTLPAHRSARDIAKVAVRQFGLADAGSASPFTDTVLALYA